MSETVNSQSVQRVQDRIRELGYAIEVRIMPENAKTAQMAADCVRCELAQIAKSIILRGQQSDKCYLVITSGANRVNEKSFAARVGEKVKMGKPDFVRKHTGFAIGGVAPVGHPEPLETYIDEDLMQFSTIWAAGGHPKALFELTPDDLMGMTQGAVICVK